MIVKSNPDGTINNEESRKATKKVFEEIYEMYKNPEKYREARLKSFERKCKNIYELYGYTEYSERLIELLKIDYNNNYDMSL